LSDLRHTMSQNKKEEKKSVPKVETPIPSENMKNLTEMLNSATHERLIVRVNRIDKTLEELNNKFNLLVDYLKININYLVEMKEEENKRKEKKYEGTDFERDHQQGKPGDEGGNDKKYEEADSEEDKRDKGNDKKNEETDFKGDHRQGKPGDDEDYVVKDMEYEEEKKGKEKKFEETEFERDNRQRKPGDERGMTFISGDKGKTEDKRISETSSGTGNVKKYEEDQRDKGMDKKYEKTDSEEDQRDKGKPDDKGKPGTGTKKTSIYKKETTFFFKSKGPFAKTEWVPQDIKIEKTNILVSERGKNKSFGLNTIKKTTLTLEDDGGFVITVVKTNGKSIKFRFLDEDNANDFNDKLQAEIQKNERKGGQKTDESFD